MKYLSVIFFLLVSCFDDNGTEKNERLILNVSKGWDYFGDEDYLKAVSAFDKALEEDRKNAEANCGKGWSLIRSQSYQDAISNFQDAVKMDDENMCFVSGEAFAHFAIENYEESLSPFKKLISILEDNMDLGPNFSLKFSEVNKSYGWALFMENKSGDISDLYAQVFPEKKPGSKSSGDLLIEILEQ